jgi:hypothetical protein
MAILNIDNTIFPSVGTTIYILIGPNCTGLVNINTTGSHTIRVGSTLSAGGGSVTTGGDRRNNYFKILCYSVQHPVTVNWQIVDYTDSEISGGDAGGYWGMTVNTT